MIVLVCVSLSAVAQDYSSLNESLLLNWVMDVENGTATPTATDRSGRGRDGTYSGTHPSLDFFLQPPMGANLNYSWKRVNSNSHIDINTPSTLSGMQEATISVWANATTAAIGNSDWTWDMATTSYTNTGMISMDGLSNENTICKARLSNGSTISATSTSSPYNNRVPVMLTCVFNGTHLNNYVNTTLEASTDSMGLGLNTEAVTCFVLNGHCTCSSCDINNVIMDDLMIWNKSLTADEIKHRYYNGSGLPYENFTDMSPAPPPAGGTCTQYNDDTSSGTYTDTFYNATGYTQLYYTNITGNFTSDVIDAGSEVEWKNISFSKFGNVNGDATNYYISQYEYYTADIRPHDILKMGNSNDYIFTFESISDDDSHFTIIKVFQNGTIQTPYLSTTELTDGGSGTSGHIKVINVSDDVYLFRYYEDSGASLMFKTYNLSDTSSPVLMDEKRIGDGYGGIFYFINNNLYVHIHSDQLFDQYIATYHIWDNGTIDNSTVFSSLYYGSHTKQLFEYVDMIDTAYDNKYLLSHQVAGDDGQLRSFNIWDNGTIELIDAYEFDPGYAAYQDMINIKDDVYGIYFYGDSTTGGVIYTFDINSSGHFVTKPIDEWVYSSSEQDWQSFHHLHSDIYLLSCNDGGNARDIRTLQIWDNGTINKQWLSDHAGYAQRGRETKGIMLNPQEFLFMDNRKGKDSDGFVTVYDYGDIKFSYRNCSQSDCSDGTWTDNNASISHLFNLKGRYFQYKADFSTASATYSPKLINASVNYCTIGAGDTVNPKVTLEFPVDVANITTSSTDLICFASDDVNLSNVSLWTSYDGWGLNETDTSGVNGTNYTFTKTFPDGTYTWNCEATDSSGNTNFTTNRTFTINTTWNNIDSISLTDGDCNIGEAFMLYGNWSCAGNSNCTGTYNYSISTCSLSSGTQNGTYNIENGTSYQDNISIICNTVTTYNFGLNVTNGNLFNYTTLSKACTAGGLTDDEAACILGGEYVNGTICAIGEVRNVGSSLAIAIFMFLVTGMFYYGGTRKNLTSKPISSFILKRSLFTLALWMSVLTSAMIATIADNAGIPLTSEIFRVMWMFGWAGYIAMIFLVVKTLFDVLGMWKIAKANQRMGEE